MKNKKSLIITNDLGIDEEFEIILTFTHPETNVNYVIYKEPNDSIDVYAARYKEKDNVSGTLEMVDTDEEFEMLQEVLDAFFSEDEE